MSKITIQSNGDNSFRILKSEWTEYEVKAKNFEIQKVYTTQDEYKVRANQVYTKEVLFWEPIKNIEVDGTTYDNYEDLSEALTPILFKKGGGTGGGGTDGIESIQEGVGIIIDDTDPKNPIISTEESSLTIEQARQNGNVLEGDIEFEDGVVLKYNKNNWFKSFSFGYPDESITFSFINGETSDNAFFQISSDGLSYSNSNSLSKGIISNREFDKQGDRKAFAQISDIEDKSIPLSGTLENKPITGDLKINTNTSPVKFESNYPDTNISFGVEYGDGVYMYFYEPNINRYTSIAPNTAGIQITAPFDSLGIYGQADYSDNDPTNKLIYTQRSYVDKSNSYSTDEIKTGGTWTDNKQIYKKTIVVTDMSTLIVNSIDVQSYIPDIATIISAPSIEIDYSTFGGYKQIGALGNIAHVKIIDGDGTPNKAVLLDNSDTGVNLTDLLSVTITLEYTKTSN